MRALSRCDPATPVLSPLRRSFERAQARAHGLARCRSVRVPWALEDRARLQGRVCVVDVWNVAVSRLSAVAWRSGLAAGRLRARCGAVRAGGSLFAAVYRDHHQALYRSVRSIVRDPVEAEDVLQAAMVKAFAALRAEERDFELLLMARPARRLASASQAQPSCSRTSRPTATRPPRSPRARRADPRRPVRQLPLARRPTPQAS